MKGIKAKLRYIKIPRRYIEAARQRRIKARRDYEALKKLFRSFAFFPKPTG